MDNLGLGLLIIGLTLVGIFGFMFIDEARARRRRRWQLIEELSAQARVDIRIGTRGDLVVTAHNTAGVSAAKVLAIWFELEPPAIVVGDSISFDKNIAQVRREEDE